MILVTGMHRSGTSLVAMTMEALGVSFGDHGAFYAADEWNAKGYFERRDVMDVNSRMISGFDRTGSDLSAFLGQMVYLAEPSPRRVVRRGPRFAAEMGHIADEIGEGAVKDPRFCVTWPAWADRVDIGACVVCIRHPFEVADSLRRRQRIPLKIGLRFWRYHMEALRDRTPGRMIVVELDSLIRQPRSELRMLVDELGLAVDATEAVRRFETTFAPDLAKTTDAEERPALEGETAELWAWLAGHRPIPTFERTE